MEISNLKEIVNLKGNLKCLVEYLQLSYLILTFVLLYLVNHKKKVSCGVQDIIKEYHLSLSSVDIVKGE
jgi:hypothetical protein